MGRDGVVCTTGMDSCLITRTSPSASLSLRHLRRITLITLSCTRPPYAGWGALHAAGSVTTPALKPVFFSP
ncbi:hypothetical protein BAUCODRAFT_120385 [Baudoinia panamericana UAMH 10762]|uniref:Uncharacterized protein n=1 Tax=Baudoinia panamericana (strain UAMH 10762) TaxID=717646 RepID=M2N523_BAUPA|nr:uncharacterized protein BAUCODRAFT_120385 [Baudoinia panamericana UAMH 10762]EMC99093.1 hypothetical protein BAUCODRAFT_120385 [Baudoinia panamericana UAMH 10762]